MTLGVQPPRTAPLRRDRHRYRINGSKPLRGTVFASGAKNAATKQLVASILTAEPCVLTNVPRILEVDVILEMLADLGTRYEWLDVNTLRVETPEITSTALSESYSGVNRIPILMLGPLLHRVGEGSVPLPGGCRIGKRPVDLHVEGLRRMGAEVVEDARGISARTLELQGAHVHLPITSVGATESILLSAVMARGTTIIRNAAVEPEVLDLVHFLQQMGALVTVDVDRKIIVEGVEALHGARHRPINDRIEVASFAAAAVATGGRVEIRGARQEHIVTFLNYLRKIGGEFQVTEDGIVFFAGGPLHAIHVETDVHPGFMTDWQQPMTVLATQAEGVSIIHETVYENRFGYTARLNEMGARIALSTACLGGRSCRFAAQDYEHSAIVMGPTPLHAVPLEIPDLRAGFAYVMAALVAKGISEISGTRFLERGYQDPVEKLRGVGADIEIVREPEASPSPLAGGEGWAEG